MRKLLSFLLFVSVWKGAFAQEENNNSFKKDPLKNQQVTNVNQTIATFIAGAVYAPKLHYYGRTDDLNSSALIPTALIRFDSIGVYISGSGVFINNTLQKMEYAGTILEGGYRFGHQKGFAGNIYANKFFYNTGQLPQSAIKAQGGLNLSYLTKYININTSASLAFSDKTDAFTAIGVDHSFRWQKDKSVFVATPTFLANAGSQNFIKENTTQSRFTLLDYEVSVPLIWARKHIFLIVTPTYVIPQNVIHIEGNPAISEHAENLFFANITLLFSFKK